MSGFQRPEGGWRLHFEGVKTNAPADAIPATKSPYAQNIRATLNQTVQTRPGYVRQFTTAAVPITDIGTYSTLDTDNSPRTLCRNSNNQIYLDTGTLVGTLSGTSLGAFFIPYRPNNSPQSFMYVGARQDYKKYSAPTAANAVTEYKVGIQEPTSSPDAAPTSLNFKSFSALAVGWAAGGTAGAPADANRIVADVATTAIVDPASNSKRWSVQVANNKSYQIGQLVNIVKGTGGSFDTVIEDIIPPLTTGATLTVQSIMYYAGVTGRCVIVPTQLPAGTSLPSFDADGTPTAASIFAVSTLSSLRRGALVRLNAAETCIVLTVTTGPNGTVSFEVVTTGTIAATQAITGLPAIVVSDVDASIIGQAITSVEVDSAFGGVGTGTLTQALAVNPFVSAMGPSTNTPQLDDYMCFGIKLSDISKLVQGVIIFDIRNGAADYVTDALYYIFNINNIILPTDIAPPFAVQANPQLFANTSVPTQITQTVPVTDPADGSPIRTETVTTDVAPDDNNIDSLTPLPTSQWATVMIPIRALKRLGNDQARTLANCQGVRLSIQTSAAVNVAISSFWIGGGGQPDVAQNTQYFYCFRPRNTVTGAKGNRSPITRYGVSPRRQQVNVVLTDTVNDVQADVWDVFRFGGTVNSWHYIGNVPNTAGTVNFTDNYFDPAANAGDILETDNYEPWPTIDTPFNATAGAAAGITTTLTVVGTNVLVIYSAAAPFVNPAPANILKWLPGTIVNIGGQNSYTLWNRPTSVALAAPPAANYFAYLFQFVEHIGSLSPAKFNILEPNVANQKLPYLWGPDAFGTIFAAGDVLRPASVYFCKSYNPDSAPDTNNQEISNPSEPILGGQVINGLSLVASSNRWWALYPNFGSTAQKYQAVEKPVGRGLISPYGHCSDGKRVFFWAKDGIWMIAGGSGVSLTDGDLFNLFPHEGVNAPVNYTYDGYTIYAPDYKYAADFRLAFINSYLYADYRDSNGNTRTLVCDLRDSEKPAWSPDFYASQVTCHYAIPQQASTLSSNASRYSALLLGDGAGDVHKQQDNSNDNGTAISSVVSTFEYNGGDIREDQIFNDAFLDFIPTSGMQVAIMSGGAVAVAATAFAASNSRVQTNKPIGIELSYCGVLFAWTDNFNTQALPSIIFAWQPMYQGVPVSVFQWKTQRTAFGMPGFKHLRQWDFCYRSTADVVITITSYDGTSPAVIILPSTGGVVKKTTFPFTFNKGMIFDIIGVSTAEWTPYLSESDLFVGMWDRPAEYRKVKDIDGPVGIRS